jgi:hypothetical protein
MELPQMFGLQLQYPHVLAIHPINFLFNARCTYICMDLSNVVFVQIKFILSTNSLYLYIHSFPMPMSCIHGS